MKVAASPGRLRVKPRGVLTTYAGAFLTLAGVYGAVLTFVLNLGTEDSAAGTIIACFAVALVALVVSLVVASFRYRMLRREHAAKCGSTDYVTFFSDCAFSAVNGADGTWIRVGQGWLASAPHGIES